MKRLSCLCTSVAILSLGYSFEVSAQRAVEARPGDESRRVVAIRLVDETLVELMERRAVIQIRFAEKHPRVVELNDEISVRLAKGERADLDEAKRRLNVLLGERRYMSRTLGPAHHRLMANAARIRVVHGIVKEDERKRLLQPVVMRNHK